MAARRADGSILTLGDLPARGDRWTSQRKRLVVECIDLELLTPAAAERRYGLTAEELGEWRQLARTGRAPEAWAQRPRRAAGGRLSAGTLDLDLDARRLAASGSPVRLSDAEWAILAALAEADGAVVTNAMLMSVLYAGGRLRGRKIVDVLVCRLRQKLGDGSSVVGVVWGRGYRLAAGDARGREGGSELAVTG